MKSKLTRGEHMIMGFIEIAQGLVKVFTLGWKRPGWDIQFARHRTLARRKRSQ